VCTSPARAAKASAANPRVPFSMGARTLLTLRIMIDPEYFYNLKT